MKLKEIIGAIEKLAPLSIQDGFDNSGLQVGRAEQEIGSVLLCLDVTEEVIDEAIKRGCQLVLSHHPLLFHPLKTVGDATYQQRCTVKAIREGIAIYSAHTSLDNAPGGVNHRIADIIGMEDLCFLSPKDGSDSGSGVVGTLLKPASDEDFLSSLKEKFGVACLRHSATDGRTIRRVAVCGGAGAFLLPDAIREGADCFVCGEFHYHDYFENSGVLLAELGHYQSEKFTIDLLRDILRGTFPQLRISATGIETNPIRYK